MTRVGRPRAGRARRVTRLALVLSFMVLLMAVQWILLSVAIDGFLRERRELLIAPTLLSGLCAGAACWLLRQVPASGPGPLHED